MSSRDERGFRKGISLLQPLGHKGLTRIGIGLVSSLGSKLCEHFPASWRVAWFKCQVEGARNPPTEPVQCLGAGTEAGDVGGDIQSRGSEQGTGPSAEAAEPESLRGSWTLTAAKDEQPTGWGGGEPGHQEQRTQHQAPAARICPVGPWSSVHPTGARRPRESHHSSTQPSRSGIFPSIVLAFCCVLLRCPCWVPGLSNLQPLGSVFPCAQVQLLVSPL